MARTKHTARRRVVIERPKPTPDSFPHYLPYGLPPEYAACVQHCTLLALRRHLPLPGTLLRLLLPHAPPSPHAGVDSGRVSQHAQDAALDAATGQDVALDAATVQDVALDAVTTQSLQDAAPDAATAHSMCLRRELMSTTTIRLTRSGLLITLLRRLCYVPCRRSTVAAGQFITRRVCGAALWLRTFPMQRARPSLQYAESIQVTRHACACFNAT